jgi:hypothetical protein
MAPAEDGFFCAPLLMFGIDPISAAGAGLLFGFLHLQNYNFFECIGKGIFYGVACFVILPHGFLTMAAGHFIVDFAGVLMLLYWRLRRADTKGEQEGSLKSEKPT